MRTQSSLDVEGVLLALALSGSVCLANGCDAGGPPTVPRVVETPEQVLRRDRAIRDAVMKGAYGKHAQRVALRRSGKPGDNPKSTVHSPTRPARDAR